MTYSRCVLWYHVADNGLNIGVNPLTSRWPLWYTGPDLVASTLLTGKPPKILRGIRLKPNEGERDGVVLSVASGLGRVLVTYDRSGRDFGALVDRNHPGLFVIRCRVTDFSLLGNLIATSIQPSGWSADPFMSLSRVG